MSIIDIPSEAKLIVLAGPNGIGKSSLFDSFYLWSRRNSGRGWLNDADYYERNTVANYDQTRADYQQATDRVRIIFHGNQPVSGSQVARKAFHIRTAYRNDPDLASGQFNRVGSALDEVRFQRLIETDAAVTTNYQRLVSDAFDSAFEHESSTTTIGDWRKGVIGELRAAVLSLFPHLNLNGLGSPMRDPTFRFTKGAASGFVYKNLSGGEKSAFDLLLDMVVKRTEFNDTIFCIDEPEAHLNPRVQGLLLRELTKLVPEQGQLWVATHSIGMLRAARDMEKANPGSVVFIDFDGHDFDDPVVLRPIKPTRNFWSKALIVALDDLAELVAPSDLVVCEGSPGGKVPGKNADHDARCYMARVGDEFPDAAFVSGGNSHDVASDRLGIASAFPSVVKGTQVRSVIDLDDHSAEDVAAFRANGTAVLSRRNIESFLYDDEVLRELCKSVSAPQQIDALLEEKQQALASSQKRGNADNDLKPAAPAIYIAAKRLLKLSNPGNDNRAFERSTLAPLLKSVTTVYNELKQDIFS